MRGRHAPKGAAARAQFVSRPRVVLHAQDRRESLILTEVGAEVRAYSAAGQAVLLLAFVPAFGAFASRVNRLQLVRWVTLFFIFDIALFFVAATFRCTLKQRYMRLRQAALNMAIHLLDAARRIAEELRRRREAVPAVRRKQTSAPALRRLRGVSLKSTSGAFSATVRFRKLLAV